MYFTLPFLATCTISFSREVKRRNKLLQLNAVGHDRSYLSLDGTNLRKPKRGHEFPKYVPCVFQKQGRAKLLDKASEYLHNTLRVILPYFCGLLLRMTNPLRAHEGIYFLARLTRSHKLCFTAA